MCAGSKGRIKDKNVTIYMGHYGGQLAVGDDVYAVDSDEPAVTLSEDEMIDRLQRFGSVELARLLVELVRDSEEY